MSGSDRANNHFLQQKGQAFSVGLMKEQHKLNEELLEKQLRANHNLSSDQSAAANRLQETQIKLSLEIHQKQADLTREIYDKQSRLTLLLIVASIFAAVLGGASGAYFATKFQSQPQTTKPIQHEQSIQSQAVEKTSAHQKKPSETSAQAEAVSTNASSPNPTLNQTTSSGVKLDKVTKKERSR